MRRFAAAQGVRDVPALMDAIARADAEIFAERPQDLLELIGYWAKHGRIASHAELIEFNIKSKLAERNPDRDVARPLVSAKAFEGAMSLAAALIFTKRNSIILPDQPVDPDRAASSIEANDALPDWDARDIQTLLSRPLFDEATYGRVRFHHRSVQEYLTAQWLHHLSRAASLGVRSRGYSSRRATGSTLSCRQWRQRPLGSHSRMIGSVIESLRLRPKSY